MKMSEQFAVDFALPPRDLLKSMKNSESVIPA